MAKNVQSWDLSTGNSEQKQRATDRNSRITQLLAAAEKVLWGDLENDKSLVY